MIFKFASKKCYKNRVGCHRVRIGVRKPEPNEITHNIYMRIHYTFPVFYYIYFMYFFSREKRKKPKFIVTLEGVATKFEEKYEKEHSKRKRRRKSSQKDEVLLKWAIYTRIRKTHLLYTAIFFKY
jgi:hypothetical protein